MKTEKDLDNLFKQGLQEPGNYADYREADWDNLEATLDKGRKRGIVFWLPVLSGVAALLLAAFGWYFNNTPNAQKPQMANVLKHDKKDLGGSNTLADGQRVTTPQTNTGTSDRLTQQQEEPNKKFRPTLMVSYAGPKHKSFLTLSAAKAGRNTTGNAATQPEQPQTEVLTAVSEQVFDKDELSNNATFADLKLPAATTPKANKKITGFHPRMAVTVLASSNINGVGSFTDSKAGTNAGLLFSMGVTKKFTLTTGALYAKTPYLTDFYNYHTPYQFKVNPENVDADCRILDIPLNVEYQLSSKGRNTFSIGSGLSSYIMLKENYHYNYAVQPLYGPTDFSVQNKNRYFMGVLNVDATYQRQINNKLSLAIQPYLKLPLTDIGNGEVKLQTTGVAVGISWNINSLKR